MVEYVLAVANVCLLLFAVFLLVMGIADRDSGYAIAGAILILSLVIGNKRLTPLVA